MGLYKQHSSAFDNSPFPHETAELGEEQIKNASEHRRETWQQLIEETDVNHSSRKAWETIKIFSSDHTISKERTTATANQLAHQLVKYGESSQKSEKMQIISTPTNLPWPNLKMA